MNATSHRQYPSLDRAWADAVTRELIARGATGPAIGDALATADAHCLDSGESAHDAFGKAQAYAASLPLRADEVERGDLGGDVRAGVGSLIGLLPMMLAFRAADVWSTRGGIPIAVGDVVAVGLILVAAALAIHRIDIVLKRPVVAWLVGSVAFAGIVGVQVWGGPTLLALPRGATIVLVIGLLAASVVWFLRNAESEPVRDPRPGATPSQTPAALRWLGAALFPVMTVIGVVLIRVIDHFTP